MVEKRSRDCIADLPGRDAAGACRAHHAPHASGSCGCASGEAARPRHWGPAADVSTGTRNRTAGAPRPQVGGTQAGCNRRVTVAWWLLSGNAYVLASPPGPTAECATALWISEGSLEMLKPGSGCKLLRNSQQDRSLPTCYMQPSCGYIHISTCAQ